MDPRISRVTREDTHALRLTSELVDLRAGDANWILPPMAAEPNSIACVARPKRKPPPDWAGVFVLEAPPRIELGIEVLQTFALPLGHGAVFRLPYYYSKVGLVCQAFFIILKKRF